MSNPIFNARLILAQDVSPILELVPYSEYQLTFDVVDGEAIFYATDIQTGDLVFLDTSLSYPETITRFKVTAVDPATTVSRAVVNVIYDDNMDPTYIDITLSQPDGLVCRPSPRLKLPYASDPDVQGLPSKFYTYLRNQDFLTLEGNSGSTFRVEYRTITSAEVTAKQLTLAYTPASSSDVMVDLVGGSSQVPMIDFSLTNTTLSWLGLALDGFLEAGDVMRLAYTTL